jgi:hypothetical protein
MDTDYFGNGRIIVATRTASYRSERTDWTRLGSNAFKVCLEL